MIEWANGQEAEWAGIPVKIVGCCPDIPGHTVIRHPASGYVQVPDSALESPKVTISGRYRSALMVTYSGNAEVPTLPYIAHVSNDDEAAAFEASPSFRKWLTPWQSYEERVSVATP